MSPEPSKLSAVSDEKQSLLSSRKLLLEQVANLERETLRLSQHVVDLENVATTTKGTVEAQRERMFSDLGNPQEKQKFDELKLQFRAAGDALCSIDDDYRAALELLARKRHELSVVNQKLAAMDAVKEKESFIELEKKLRDQWYQLTPRWMAAYKIANGVDARYVDLPGLCNAMTNRHGMPLHTDFIAIGMRAFDADKQQESTK